MRVAITHYPTGRAEVTQWFDMPRVPRIGDTVHFDDRAWRVRHVSWAPDNDEPVTPGDTAWHAELSVQ
jgi:hypothetical protein